MNRQSSKQQSYSFEERKRRRAMIGWVAAVVVVFTWGFTFSRLSFLPVLAIDHIEVYGADAELVPQMTAAAWQAMDGSYGGLFSRSNMFLYPRTAMAKAVTSSSPRVGNVLVRRTMRSVSISISEKVPEALTCADLPDLNDSGLAPSSNCYFTDSNGIIFRAATSTDTDKFMRYYVPDLSDSKPAELIGSSTPKFGMLQALVKSIKMGGIDVHAVLLKDDQSYELYAENPDGGSFVVIQMSDRVSLDTQRDNLIAYWSKMVSDSHISGKKLEWSEIKLQYPPNVYSR